VAVTAKQSAGTSGAEASGTGASGAGTAADRVPYEQARDELTEVVKRLESGGLTLEQSLDLWERGERLAAICEEWLEGARARLAAAVTERKAAPGDPAAPF
jgi:exodeoxyribonuclease VII small subunit